MFIFNNKFIKRNKTFYVNLYNNCLDTGEPLEQEGFTSWTSWTADPKNAKQLVRNRSCKNEDLGCDGYLDETLVVSDIISSSVTKKKVPRVSGKRSGGKKKKEIVAGTIEKGQVKPGQYQ